MMLPHTFSSLSCGHPYSALPFQDICGNPIAWHQSFQTPYILSFASDSAKKWLCETYALPNFTCLFYPFGFVGGPSLVKRDTRNESDDFLTIQKLLHHLTECVSQDPSAPCMKRSSNSDVDGDRVLGRIAVEFIDGDQVLNSITSPILTRDNALLESLSQAMNIEKDKRKLKEQISLSCLVDDVQGVDDERRYDQEISRVSRCHSDDASLMTQLNSSVEKPDEATWRHPLAESCMGGEDSLLTSIPHSRLYPIMDTSVKRSLCLSRLTSRPMLSMVMIIINIEDFQTTDELLPGAKGDPLYPLKYQLELIQTVRARIDRELHPYERGSVPRHSFILLQDSDRYSDDEANKVFAILTEAYPPSSCEILKLGRNQASSQTACRCPLTKDSTVPKFIYSSQGVTPREDRSPGVADVERTSLLVARLVNQGVYPSLKRRVKSLDSRVSDHKARVGNNYVKGLLGVIGIAQEDLDREMNGKTDLDVFLGVPLNVDNFSLPSNFEGFKLYKASGDLKSIMGDFSGALTQYRAAISDLKMYQRYAPLLMAHTNDALLWSSFQVANQRLRDLHTMFKTSIKSWARALLVKSLSGTESSRVNEFSWQPQHRDDNAAEELDVKIGIPVISGPVFSSSKLVKEIDHWVQSMSRHLSLKGEVDKASPMTNQESELYQSFSNHYSVWTAWTIHRRVLDRAINSLSQSLALFVHLIFELFTTNSFSPVEESRSTKQGSLDSSRSTEGQSAPGGIFGSYVSSGTDILNKYYNSGGRPLSSKIVQDHTSPPSAREIVSSVNVVEMIDLLDFLATVCEDWLLSWTSADMRKAAEVDLLLSRCAERSTSEAVGYAIVTLRKGVAIINKSASIKHGLLEIECSKLLEFIGRMKDIVKIKISTIMIDGSLRTNIQLDRSYYYCSNPLSIFPCPPECVTPQQIVKQTISHLPTTNRARAVFRTLIGSHAIAKAGFKVHALSLFIRVVSDLNQIAAKPLVKTNKKSLNFLLPCDQPRSSIIGGLWNNAITQIRVTMARQSFSLTFVDLCLAIFQSILLQKTLVHRPVVGASRLRSLWPGPPEETAPIGRSLEWNVDALLREFIYVYRVIEKKNKSPPLMEVNIPYAVDGRAMRGLHVLSRRRHLAKGAQLPGGRPHLRRSLALYTHANDILLPQVGSNSQVLMEGDGPSPEEGVHYKQIDSSCQDRSTSCGLCGARTESSAGSESSFESRMNLLPHVLVMAQTMLNILCLKSAYSLEEGCNVSIPHPKLSLDSICEILIKSSIIR
eukprot:GHVH01005296.1.p1 GENE.GHVH01005296.1~~GHVH01005296.1.p1  ORF type:complete len:1263 (+),score=174.98 GHVH01005296.1:49-3837(+)